MRDRLIDGYRGVAVLCVVAAHSFAYRFAPPGPLQRLAEPLAEMGVQLFFVISGYIITTLLIREEEREGRISIPAFYARRFFRILPPLFAYYAALFLMMAFGIIAFEPSTVANSAFFTCNTGLTDCQWWVAHTWSLAVEEQFYLAWPLLLTLLHRRALWLAVSIAALLAVYLAVPHQFHSNWISFSCIAAGALYATNASVRDRIAALASYAAWIGAVAVFVAVPFIGFKLSVLTPLLVVYILFAARQLPVVVKILEAGPLNAVGLCSYSLYLWQQAFLASPLQYVAEPLALALLPPVVLASYLFIEKPFGRVGHLLSARLKSGRVRNAEA
ncbi:MAG TPA: acyltransferase [Sphingomicrobium sp.]|nr:acyltransferase [Sphingomicrobium sp.]